MEPIRLAIVGLDRFADLLFGCLEKSDRLKLCAVCETRPALLNRYRDKFPDIQFYDDPRAMVLRARPNALLLWRECCENEFLDSVMSQGCWPILRPPISGGLATALKLIKQAEKHNVGIFVWTPWLFFPCYESIQDWLADQQIRSFSCRSSSPLSDLELPTEETLLSAGMYPSMFLIHHWMGLPEQIYCRQLHKSGPTAESLIQYFGVAHLIYPQSLGLAAVGINAGPAEEQLFVTGNSRQIRVTPTEAHLFDCAGNFITSTHVYDPAEVRQIAYTRHFDRIWQAIVEQQRSTEFELMRHIPVLAILDVAALSAKTGHPEQLAKTASRIAMPA